MKDTKNYILGIALKLFLQKSFKEVTMKEIVEKTGLSKGAFYHYFKSKEQLFLEIVEQFFTSLMEFNYDLLNQESLEKFYQSYIKEMNILRFDFFELEESKGEDVLDLNFFSLLFDTFKLFPEYREKMDKFHQKENGIWINVVQHARESNEIQSSMSDEEIAMMFIYSGDGLALGLTMNSATHTIEPGLEKLWGSFYRSIKKQ